MPVKSAGRVRASGGIIREPSDMSAAMSDEMDLAAWQTIIDSISSKAFWYDSEVSRECESAWGNQT
jgi:hypothetical protein